MDTATQQAEAFKRLYPDQYLSRFIANGIHIDGRPFSRARPATIGVGVVGTADSSALVKIGDTTAMAGIKLEVMVPTEDKPDEGQIAVLVELAPCCSSDMRPGRASEGAQCLTEQVTSALHSAQCVQLAQLGLDFGKAAWLAYLDIYILDANGALLDAALLAALAALASLQLPTVAINDVGQVQPASKAGQAGERQLQGARLALHSRPMALTCGMCDGHLLTDLNAEEERLAASTATVVADAAGHVYCAGTPCETVSCGSACVPTTGMPAPPFVRVAGPLLTYDTGVYKPGGLPMTPQQLTECIQAARKRSKEVDALLQQALEPPVA